MSDISVVVVTSSPRKSANSTILADQAIKAMHACGVRVETIDLNKLQFWPCTACDACQAATDQDCVLKDDMQAVYPKLRRAQALLLASPIYWFDVSAQLKLFIDRGFYALNGPQGHALNGKPVGVILTYGDTDPFTSGAINALRSFQDMFRFIGAPIIGSVYGTANQPGDVQKQQALLDQAYQLGEQLVRAVQSNVE
jgi:multimeric flavodoxin WrbA